MFNYYLVESNGRYLNTNKDVPKWVDKNKATRYDDEFSADYMGAAYAKNFQVITESYDK